MADVLLLESGDRILLESGDGLLLEGVAGELLFPFRTFDPVFLKWGTGLPPPPITLSPIEVVWELPSFAECPCDMMIVNDADEGMALGVSHCSDCLPQPFYPVLTADSERKSVVIPTQHNLIIYLVNDWGALCVVTNHAGHILEFVTTGLILSKADGALFGHYLGWTVKGLDPPFRLETVEIQYAPTRAWDTTTA